MNKRLKKKLAKKTESVDVIVKKVPSRSGVIVSNNEGLSYDGKLRHFYPLGTKVKVVRFIDDTFIDCVDSEGFNQVVRKEHIELD